MAVQEIAEFKKTSNQTIIEIRIGSGLYVLLSPCKFPHYSQVGSSLYFSPTSLFPSGTYAEE
jgi:hypothetical protein